MSDLTPERVAEAVMGIVASGKWQLASGEETRRPGL